MAYDFDLFVIGAGSGGVRAARIAAGHGARVAIAEQADFGGTCVNRGCVPKKLMVHASRLGPEFAEADAFGWRVQGAAFDWGTFIRAKDVEIARLAGKYLETLNGAGVTVHACRAVLEDAHTVSLSDSGQRVTAEHILIATGGHPSYEPRFVGRELAINSDDVFHLPDLPRRVLIVGSGYIAIEFAGIFAGFGAQATLVYRGQHLLRGMDQELAQALEDAYRARHIGLLPDTQIERLERHGEALRATFSNGATHECDAVMLATGRIPNVAGLNLDRVGVEQGKAGAIVTDLHNRTSVPSIYAIGDVTGRLDATPVAIREGHFLADRLFAGATHAVDYSLIARAVFSTPEAATVGLPEEAARERYPRLRVFRDRLRSMRHAFAGHTDTMLIKVLVDGDTGRIVGAHLLADSASEIIQTFAIAITAGATLADLQRTLPLHPTIAEELITLREVV